MSSRKKPRSKLGTKAAPAQPARAARRRWLIVGTSVLAVTAIAAVAVAILLRPSGGVASGVPWERLKTQDVHSLVFPGPDSSTVLFGHHGGILRSTDGGRSWAPLPVRQDAMGMAAAGDGSIIIAGHLVFQASRDGGATWAPINADLPNLDIHGFARSLSDPGRMWAYLAEGGIYESIDYGIAWTKVYDGSVAALTAIRDGDQDALIGIESFRGVMRSPDGGRTWAAIGTPPTAPVTSVAATEDGRVLILGGTNGLYRSDDAGATWRQVLKSGVVLAAAMSGEGSTVAIVDEDTLFYRSDDGGVTWPGP